MSAEFPEYGCEVPVGKHYAILTPKVVSVPGDDGFGRYGNSGYDIHSWTIQVFNSRDEWVEEISRNASLVTGKKDILPIVMEVPEVETKTVVKTNAQK